MEWIKPNFKSYRTTNVREAFRKQGLAWPGKEKHETAFLFKPKKINNTRFISSTA